MRISSSLKGALFAEAKFEHHGDRESRAFADTLELGGLRENQGVLEVLETEVAVVALDGEGFAEDRLETEVIAGGGVRL